MSTYSNCKIFAFDLDGTVYTGNSIIDGAADLIHHLNHGGIKVIFFTNSSTRTRKQLLEKLTRMGLSTDLPNIYSSAYATAVFAAEKSWANVMCIGTEGLINELEDHGVNVTNDSSIADALVIGLDLEFTYNKLAAIMPLKDRNTPIVACNRDNSFPVEDGKLLPGCGPIVAAVEAALGRKIDYLVGKPNTYMLDLLSTDLDLKRTDIVVVGDSLESDIEMAHKYGCKSFLISRQLSAAPAGTIIVREIGEIGHHL